MMMTGDGNEIRGRSISKGYGNKRRARSMCMFPIKK